MRRNAFIGNILAIIVVSILGCVDNNERVAEIALDCARWQAEQSQTIVESNQSIADGSKQLVSADAISRQELAKLQRELRADQAEIARQYEDLATHHTQWVEDRERNATAGASLVALGLILACLAPLVLAAWAMRGRDDPLSSEEIQTAIDNSK